MRRNKRLHVVHPGFGDPEECELVWLLTTIGAAPQAFGNYDPHAPLADDAGALPTSFPKLSKPTMMQTMATIAACDQ
jgi:hypothetical protein